MHERYFLELRNVTITCELHVGIYLGFIFVAHTCVPFTQACEQCLPMQKIHACNSGELIHGNLTCWLHIENVSELVIYLFLSRMVRLKRAPKK